MLYSEEEKKAIYELKCAIDTKKESEDYEDKQDLPILETLLNLIEKQDKMIDLMAKYIDDYSIEDEFCTKKNCYADDYINGHCEKCLNCIKEHFRKKVEDERNKI